MYALCVANSSSTAIWHICSLALNVYLYTILWWPSERPICSTSTTITICKVCFVLFNLFHRFCYIDIFS